MYHELRFCLTHRRYQPIMRMRHSVVAQNEVSFSGVYLGTEPNSDEEDKLPYTNVHLF